MDIECALRQAMNDLADDTRATDGLAATALRRARRRQYAARTAVAGTAAAVAVPVGISVLPDPGPGTSLDPATSGPAADPTPAEPDILPAPLTRELSTGELQTAFQTCRQGIDGDGDDSYGDWQPVFGLAVDTDVDPGVPTTWVVARRDDDYRGDCALDSTGQQVGGGGVYGGKSTPDLLYALVDGQEGGSVGRYVDPIARVTVQHEDSPEQEAVLRGGFWFFPIDETPSASDDHNDNASPEDRETPAEDPAGDNRLIGVPAGYTFRGYDAEDELIYDSTTDGPTVDDCYADPTGTEFVGNWAGRTDPSECVPTHQWEPLPLP